MLLKSSPSLLKTTNKGVCTVITLENVGLNEAQSCISLHEIRQGNLGLGRRPSSLFDVITAAIESNRRKQQPGASQNGNDKKGLQTSLFHITFLKKYR